MNPNYLAEWRRYLPYMTRNQAAADYASQQRYPHAETDWPALNALIVDRWSESGLEYIKRRAHRL